MDGALFFWEWWEWEPSPVLGAGRLVWALSLQGIAQPPASFFHSGSSAERFKVKDLHALRS